MKAECREILRHPVVADRFYSGTEDSLRAEVLNLIGPDRGPDQAIGAVMPHAGYVYSGSIAGKTAAAIPIPRNVVLLGPNHTGRGPADSVFPGGFWRMPFGDVPVNEPLSERILDRCELATSDETAHLTEHSIEVQLPFLYYGGNRDLCILPIIFSMLGKEECRLVGKALADVISDHEEDILMIASSDMTHYESRESAKTKDSDAIARILDLDPDGLLEVVFARKISMCGVIPTAVMLYASLALGAREAKLVQYGTSGEVSGDYNQVVGYAGITVY